MERKYNKQLLNAHTYLKLGNIHLDYFQDIKKCFHVLVLS